MKNKNAKYPFLKNNIEKIRLGDNIHSKSYNKKEFGELFDSTGSLVSKWEKGTVIPNPERLFSISKFGNITVEELLYGNEFHPKIVAHIINYCKENSMLFEKDTANFIANKYSTKSFKEDENGVVLESNTPPLSIDEINLNNVIKDYLFFSSSYTKEEEDYMKNHTFEYLKDKKERNSLTEFERKLHDKIDKDLHPSRKANQTDMDNF